VSVRALLGVLVGAALTALLLWMVLGGANVWRKVAWREPVVPDGGVRVRFFRAPVDGGAFDARSVAVPPKGR
jgi:hypothetical protein